MRLHLAAATTVTAMALLFATPALADIVAAKPSDAQGFLVHANGGGEDVGPIVWGNLNVSGGADEPKVYFRGTTTAAANNDLRIQNGAGQAELTGAIIAGNAISSLNIYLDNFPLATPDPPVAPYPTSSNDPFKWIELSLAGTQGAAVNFVLTDDSGTEFNFSNGIYFLGTGETKFAFRAILGQGIKNLFFSVGNGSVASVRQVRIDPGLAPEVPDPQGNGVPEPSTWAMMLLGFGAVGAAMRRRRPTDARVRYNFA